MKKSLSIIVFAAMMAFSGTASAHYFWVNAHDSFAHPPGHILVSLGFGHALPMDDLLSGDFGNILVKSIELTGPDGRKMPLNLPDTSRKELKDTLWNSTLEDGELAVQKITMSPESMKGIYMVSAESVPFYMTSYKNKDGKIRMATKTIDQIDDLEEVQESFLYMGYAKTYVNMKSDWKELHDAGADLEITPLTDLSNLKPGDMVEFDTEFMGKKLNTTSKSIEYMTAFSDTYAMPDGFQLMSFIMNGKTQFRVPEAGHWLVSVYVKKDVADTPELAHLKGKVLSVFYGATLSFTVKP